MNFKFTNAVLTNYFSSGWLFFLPYLIFYNIFWITNLPVPTLLDLFFILHLLNFTGFVYFAFLKYSLIKFNDLIFWAAIISLFYNTGAYLEFPSDPMSHLFRIFQWEHVDNFINADAFAKVKFSYFFGYSILKYFDPIRYKLGLDLYHTFWGLLLSLQFYKLALSTLKNEAWAKLAVCCIIFMLGNSSFNFFCYYGISSTMLAMIAFLAALNLLILNNQKNTNGIILIVLALILGISNHLQSFLLFISCGLGVFFHLQISTKGWSKFFKTTGLTFLLFGLIFQLISLFPFYDEYRRVILPYILSNEWFYPWGGFKIFSLNPEINNASGRFMQILGWYGILNCIISLYLIKKNHLIGWISLTPILILLYPPFAQFLAYILIKFKTIIVFQRIFLAIPISFSIIFVLKMILKSKLSPNKYLLLLPIIFLTHLLASINPYANQFGRGFNFLEKSQNDVFFERISKTTDIIKKTHKSRPNILSDTATQTIINAQLGLYDDDRLISQSLTAKIRNLGGIERIHSNSNFTHILMLSEQPKLSPRGSILGHASGHWDNQHLSNSVIYDPSLEKKLDELIINGWKKEKISPWYIVYIRGDS